MTDLKMKRLPVILILFLMLVSCAERTESILPPGTELRPGDVVFRQGVSPESYAVILSDREGIYSHIGIVADSAGCPVIVHAVPGEPDFDGDPDRIKMDAPDKFFMRSRAEIGEVMRIPDPEKAAIAAENALRLYKNKILFDHDYDDSDSTKMYCTELVIYAYKCAGVNLAHGEKTSFKMPLLSATCWFPSAVHSSPLLESVAVF